MAKWIDLSSAENHEVGSEIITTTHHESKETEVTALGPKLKPQESNSRELKQSESVIESEAEMELKEQAKVSDASLRSI